MTAIAPLRFESPRPADARREGLSNLPLRPPVGVEAPMPLGAQPTLSALRASPWFAGWPPAALTALAAHGSLRSFGAGQVIAPEGEPLESVALVVKGRVRVVRRAPGGREVTLEVWRAGELCTDGLFEERFVAGNDWIAAETSLLLFLPKTEFLGHVRSVPEAALSLARDLERRLQRTKRLAAGLALADAESRLHQVLLRLAREEGEALPDGALVRRCPTQQEIGNMIGACRETVSRMIAELARQGLLSSQGRKLKLSARFIAQLGEATPG
jgi:CRP-like cAMP-binding protein